MPTGAGTETPTSPAVEPHRVTAAELLVGCVTENDARYLDQTLRLVQSIHWFGGELAKARRMVCAIEGIDAAARSRLEALGCEVRVVRRFHPANGTSNRMRLIEEALATGCEMLLSLDCDTVVARDPLPLLRRETLAKTEDLPTVTHDVFERLFQHYGVPLPPADRRMRFTRTPTIPYFNAGVLVLPAPVAREILPVWAGFNRRLADRPELVYPCERHLHQASLSLALAVCGVTVGEAPVELNYQLNATHLQPPDGFLAVDPAILHYHDRVDRDGFLLPSPYPLARLRIDLFNERLRRGGASLASSWREAADPQARVVLLGTAGSDRRAVARLLATIGLEGDGGSVAASDVDVLHEAILAAAGGSTSDPAELDPERLAATPHDVLDERARELVARAGGRAPWLLAGAHLEVLVPFWRKHLRRPVCLLVHSEPLRLARSLAAERGLPLSVGIALWELHSRQALANSLGAPRILVSLDELVECPLRALTRVADELARRGVEGLAAPDPSAVEREAPALPPTAPSDRSARRDWLSPAQHELLEALETGAALAMEPVPPLSDGAAAILAAHRAAVADARSRRADLDYRDGVIAVQQARIELERRESAELRSERARWQRESHSAQEAMAAAESASRRALAGAAGREDAVRLELRRSQARAEELRELLAAVLASRSWRFGHAMSRLLRRVFPSGRATAPERWRRLTGGAGDLPRS